MFIRNRLLKSGLILFSVALAMVLYFVVGASNKVIEPTVTYHLPEKTGYVEPNTGRIWSPTTSLPTKPDSSTLTTETTDSEAIDNLEECCDDDEDISLALQEYSESDGLTQEEVKLIKRKRELTRRLIELGDKDVELGKLLIESVDNELKAMYSLFALMSPKELEFAKQQALLTHSQHDVDDFFNDVANAESKTIEEIQTIAQDILSFREFYDMVDAQLHDEYEALKIELAEVGLVGGVN